MKNEKASATVSLETVNEDDVRDHAYHLYIQSGCIPGRDLDNWLEAKACLSAFIPKSESPTGLHRRSQKKQPASRQKAFAA